ncbi:synaptosomal-associated protein 29 [Plakobranchus ocellatus]|uniref:Synaptosomal-associated protein 29 n=1 Tax=Plakobranchus ocellatus TaxID=259542 RepID=A0AAV3ZBU6_9GAST|nr:synaptosomal-associated protein 29 [Plakobranchus ocellatus]
MSQYKSSNPFEDDDDDGRDFVLVGKSKPAATYSYNSGHQSSLASRQTKPQKSYSSEVHSSGYGYRGESESSPFEDRREQLMREINASENRQLESTQRALASIYDSEAMGVATAEELVRQGEILDNIETKTDDMQHTLKTSQRHLNNIKSVFGGIKNWWAGGSKKPAVNSQAETNGANAKLRAALDKHAKVDTSGFYEDDDRDLDSRFMAGSRKPGDGQYTVIEPVTRSAREDELDFNLGMMSDGMSRLKGLALGLGDEIERQNEQLDRINVKVGDTDDLLSNQNRQMRKILKK